MGAHEYLSVHDPRKAVLPLNYMGKLVDPKIRADEVGDFYVGPCGANVFHFRPSDEADDWKTYVGGDPRRRNKGATAGRAYIALTSADQFWVLVSLASFCQRSVKTSQ